MVPYGAIWYQMGPYDTTWYYMVPYGRSVGRIVGLSDGPEHIQTDTAIFISLHINNQ